MTTTQFLECFGNPFLGLFEMQQDYADYANSKRQDILPHIFGDKLRIAEPLMNGKKYEIEQVAKDLTDFDIDFDQWVGYKLTDADKKNPMKLNKLLNKRKVMLTKQAEQAEDEEKTKLLAMVDRLDKLLKVSDLRGAYSAPSTMVVIYSRAPIDTIRMSDHGQIASCHSPGGQYFSHAIADAGNAGVTYVVSQEDFEKIGDLQAAEIFKDDDRGVAGIVPLARTRIRLLLGPDDVQVGVPTQSVYGDHKVRDDLYIQTVKFFTDSQKKQAQIFKDQVGTQRGGTYEDWNDGVTDNFERMFGFTPKVTTDKSDVNDATSEFPNLRSNNNDHSEQITDAIREAIRESDYIAGLDIELYGEGGLFTVLKGVTFDYDGDLERAKKILNRVPDTFLAGVNELSDTKLRAFFEKRINPEVLFSWNYGHEYDYGWDIDMDMDMEYEPDEVDVHWDEVQRTWEEEMRKFTQSLGDVDYNDPSPDLSAFHKLQSKLLGVPINPKFIKTENVTETGDAEFESASSIETYIERTFEYKTDATIDEVDRHVEVVNARLDKKIQTRGVDPGHRDPRRPSVYLMTRYASPVDEHPSRFWFVADLQNFSNNPNERAPNAEEMKEVQFLTSPSFRKYLVKEFNSLGRYQLNDTSD